jgi:hypothetical protein
MQFIKDFFHKRKISKLRKQIARLQNEALHYQRNGKLRHYAEIVKEMEELTDTLTQTIDEKKEFSYTESETDFIDYDGMGNQGRFPTGKK